MNKKLRNLTDLFECHMLCNCAHDLIKHYPKVPDLNANKFINVWPCKDCDCKNYSIITNLKFIEIVNGIKNEH